MATILLSDFHYMKRFAAACVDDINKLKCGRLDPKEKKGVQQGSTIECLSKHVRELSSECHLQTLRIAEMQADDYHLDRAVYFACRDNRENFCQQIFAGDGRVYRCLMNNKMDPTMSQECREQLTRLQKLISLDFKASKGLVKFCSDDIKKYDCDMGNNKQKAVQLSRILACLENAIHKGENTKFIFLLLPEL
ncbi:hypothetical protein QYM36_001587 [Artemia franciscana]|uniref:Golgi apparatus protein 1 n=1 Tax=Artemia franciscana TaxID=6661 RepID=A0AA88LIN8_ARTSF|nr:hypothetical protein QYM36_001587 [Artemia franciscana]